jgi:hypothetical protein
VIPHPIEQPIAQKARQVWSQAGSIVSDSIGPVRVGGGDQPRVL